jgi:hypothetical protein
MAVAEADILLVSLLDNDRRDGASAVAALLLRMLK